MEDSKPLKTLFVELTPRCNQQCIYCYNSFREDNGQAIGEPDFESITALLDSVIDQVRLTTITLTGGEPFMREDIHRIIDFINNRGLKVGLISNGGLITPEIAQKLGKQNISYIQVTMAGKDARTHDRVCGNGTFAKVGKAVRYLQEAGITVGGSYLCTSYNYMQAGDIFERFASMNIKQIAFNRFNPSGDPNRIVIDLMPTRSQVMEALTKANEKSGKYKLNVFNTMPIPPCFFDYDTYPHIKFSHCSAGLDNGQLSISPDGSLRLCPLQKESLGSLKDTPLKTILAKGGAQEYRQKIPGFCKECPFAEICTGGCGAAADWVFGSAAELDPFLAQHVMEDFQERITKKGKEKGILVPGKVFNSTAGVYLPEGRRISPVVY